MEGLISVIVPIYNAEMYLNECIDSIINQSYEKWELIVINDGSTDRSWDIISKYAGRDSRIRPYNNENHGVSYTRNFGIDYAIGEYLCFVDADDVIMPNYLVTLLDSITESDADVVYCGCKLLYGDKLVKKAPKIKCGVYDFNDLSYRAIDAGTLSGILFGSACWALYRRNLITDNGVRFDASIRRNEDGVFNLEVVPHAGKIAVTDYDGYIYRQWQSVSRKVPQNKKDNELDAVSDIIAQRCHFYDNLDRQLKCRKLSILFWDMLQIAKGEQSARRLARELKDYVSNTEFDSLYAFLDFDELNKYKKLLINLVYKKKYFWFVVLIKYVKPFVEKRLKH